MKTFVCFLVLCLFSNTAFGTRAYIDGQTLIVSGNGEMQRFVLPAGVLEAGQVEIVVRPEKKPLSENSGGGGSGSGNGGGSAGNSLGSTASQSENKEPAPPRDINAMLVRANRLYNQKKFGDALSILDQIEVLSPQNERVKTMKGSLYFLMGWHDAAKVNWEESLRINPNQPQVRVLLDKVASTSERNKQ